VLDAWLVLVLSGR